MSNFEGWRAFRILLLAVAMIGLVALVIMRRPEGAMRSSAGPGAVSVQAAAVTRGPLRSVITATAGIEASQQVIVAPRVAAPIAAIHVDVDATVKTGDALATLDAGTLRAQVQQAHAAVLSANARLGLVADGATTADLATASAALLTALNLESTAQQALDALQGRTDAAIQANAAQRDSDRMRAQRTTAQANIDTAVAAASGYGATAVQWSITRLDSTVSARCTQIGNRELCAVIALSATSAGGLAGLVRALNAGTPAVPTDFVLLLTQFEADTATLNAPGLSDAVFRLVQASAALPGVDARATNSTLSLRSTGAPTAENLANAVRSRDAANAAVTASRERLEKLQRGPENADLLSGRAAQAGALAGLAIAEASLEQTIVRAPFDGVVAQRLLDVGAAASPLTPLFVLVTRAIELRLAVDEARIAQVRPGQPAELTVSAYPSRTFSARVAVVAPIGDPRTHTFDVRVLADDASGLLRPGMLAEVRLVTGEQTDALLVPAGAIVAQNQGPVVFTVRDGKVTLRRVRLGASDGRVTAVLDGVSVGDQVVVGQGALRDGQAVTVRMPAPPTTPTAAPARAQ